MHNPLLHNSRVFGTGELKRVFKRDLQKIIKGSAENLLKKEKKHYSSRKLSGKDETSIKRYTRTSHLNS